MSSFYIEVDKNDLKYVQKKFRDAPKNAARVLRNAINQTATVANRKIKSGRSAGYTNTAVQDQQTEIRSKGRHHQKRIKESGKFGWSCSVCGSGRSCRGIDRAERDESKISVKGSPFKLSTQNGRKNLSGRTWRTGRSSAIY